MQNYFVQPRNSLEPAALKSISDSLPPRVGDFGTPPGETLEGFFFGHSGPHPDMHAQGPAIWSAERPDLPQDPSASPDQERV